MKKKALATMLVATNLYVDSWFQGAVVQANEAQKVKAAILLSPQSSLKTMPSTHFFVFCS